LLGVLFPLREYISIWNTRMINSISSISLLREFCLNGRIYNILNKIGDKYIKRKKRDRNTIL